MLPSNRIVSLLKPAFWGIVVLFALFNIYQLAFRSSKALHEPMDFRIYYLGTKVYAERQNFYSDSLLRLQWQQIVADEQVVSYTMPGHPNSVFVYLPALVLTYYPYILVPWQTAKNLALAASLIMLVLSAFMISRLQRKHILYALGILALLMAFKGTRFALLTGQPMLFCLGLCAAALYFNREKKNILAGILVGIASFKFSFVLPLGFWFMLNREWKTVIAAACTALLLNLAVWGQYGFSAILFSAFTDHVKLLWEFAHAHGETNSLNTNTTELSTMIAYCCNIDLQALKTVSFSCYTGSYIVAAWLMLKKKAPAYHILVLLYLSDFCFSHHLLYDAIVLVLIMLCTNDLPLRQKTVICLLLLPLMLPLNQFFQARGWYGLMTITPLFVLIIYLYWLRITVLQCKPFLRIQPS